MFSCTFVDNVYYMNVMLNEIEYTIYNKPKLVGAQFASNIRVFI